VNEAGAYQSPSVSIWMTLPQCLQWLVADLTAADGPLARHLSL
jgi:hypothetical protein